MGCKVYLLFLFRVIANESSSLSVLVDIVSKFYDFYANCDVFISAVSYYMIFYIHTKLITLVGTMFINFVFCTDYLELLAVIS